MTRKTKINRIREWLADKEFRLIIKPKPQIAIVDLDRRTVYVPDDSDCVSYALHECGHIIAAQCLIAHPLTEIIEEIDAWLGGAIVAQELGIPLPRGYWRFSKECLKTYL